MKVTQVRNIYCTVCTYRRMYTYTYSYMYMLYVPTPTYKTIFTGRIFSWDTRLKWTESGMVRYRSKLDTAPVYYCKFFKLSL